MLTVRDVYVMAAALTGEIEESARSVSNMTVRQVYAIAAAFIGDKEGDDNDERDFAPIYMKVLLQEALPTENSIRKSYGESELMSAPTPGIDDVIPYDDKIVRGALPYGLAWQYHQDAGNNQLAAQYRNMFVEGIETAKKKSRGFTVPYMNILLQEALGAENSIRAAHNEPELGAAPFIEALDNGLVYHDSLVRAAFPYGLAWQYWQNAGNVQLSEMYRNLFVEAVNKAKCVLIRRSR